MPLWAYTGASFSFCLRNTLLDGLTVKNLSHFFSFFLFPFLGMSFLSFFGLLSMPNPQLGKVESVREPTREQSSTTEGWSWWINTSSFLPTQWENSEVCPPTVSHMVPSGIAIQLPTVLKHASDQFSLSFFPFLSHFSIHLFSKGDLVHIIRREPSLPQSCFLGLCCTLILQRGSAWALLSSILCVPSSPVCDGLAQLHAFILVFLCKVWPTKVLGI